MKNILVLVFICAALDVSAGIRVYNPETNKEIKKPVEYLKQQGVIPGPGELTEEQFKNMSKADFKDYINQVPNDNKKIENQKLSGMGTVLYFTDIKSLEPKSSKIMNKVGELKDVRVEFFFKQPKTPSAVSLVGLKMGTDFKYMIKMDSRNKIIRRLHVSSFPTIIYIDPDQNRSSYSGSAGGVAALKMRINELKTLKALKAQQQY